MTRLTLIDETELVVDADVEGGTVAVSAPDLELVTGWTLKPEGLCRGPVCVPFEARGDRVDLARVAHALGRSLVVHEDVAAMAGDPMSGAMRSSASIDELELPDLDGRPVRMADTAGRKRLLIAWASW